MNCNEAFSALVQRFMEREGMTKKATAQALGLGMTAFNNRLACKSRWRMSDLAKARDAGMFTLRELDSMIDER